MKRNVIIRITFISIYSLFLAVSFVLGYNPGKEIAFNFISFLIYMLKILPCAFILIGLFEVWVKKEVIEKHLGEESGIKGYMWIILLAGTIAGGLLVAFPIAYSLYNKGAKLSIVFTYMGAVAICRVPMTLYEASFMGVKFTMIRLLISLPLVIITSILLGNYLIKRNYKIVEGK
ncbi:MAG: permease [Candidatus Caldatribacteriota bacterium]|nr:permease [Candidatus Caldatribacteriota bacterium]